MSDISKMNKINSVQQLLFRVYRIDYNVRLPNWSIPRTDRPYTVFWYVKSGRKTVFINDIEYTVKKGDFVVFPSEIPFEIVESEQAELDHYEIALSINFGPYNLMSLYKLPIVTALNEHIALIKQWEQLEKDWNTDIKFLYKTESAPNRNELNDVIYLSDFYAKTLEWFRMVVSTLKGNTESLFPIVDSRLRTIFYYINENISKKITLEELADLIYVSKSHLIYLFKEHIGQPPMDYVKKIKIQKAKELLLTTKLPLNKISERIGYDNQSQFSRTFRQDTGMSPTAYRNSEQLF